MAPLKFVLLFLCYLGTAGSLAQAPVAVPAGAVWVLELDGAVGPASSDYLLRGMENAAQADAALVVIRMNTPGGLDGAMRDIIQGILASPVPVASYVSPQGARAASAGTYILYASHIAAMAPATNLGAATPVSIGAPGPAREPAPEEGSETKSAPRGSTAMERKMVNDAAAYIRGLADLRGRNSEWAEAAVRDALSLTAQEALEKNVIDIVAADMRALLQELEGRPIDVEGRQLVLKLADAPIHEAAPDWRTKFLATITDPNLVLILGMIGFYGIILEFYNPGSLVPGTIGVICLLLAGYSLQLLPVNYAGLALIAVGLGLMIAEAMAPSFGILGVGGIVAFVIGGIILFDTEVEAFQVAWPLLLVFGVTSAAFIVVTISIALRMRRRAVSTGIDHMLGLSGEALDEINTEGMVRVGAEIWQAHSEQAIAKGSRVVVTEVSGLLLHVKEETT